MRRRSLSPAPNRFEKLQARRESTLCAALQQAGVDIVMKGKTVIADQYQIHSEATWPVSIDSAWLKLALDYRDKDNWPCLAWPDGYGWSIAVPLASLDHLTAGPPLRHFTLMNLEAFAALLRGRQ